MCFGLKVDFSKSSVMGVNVSDEFLCLCENFAHPSWILVISYALVQQRGKPSYGADLKTPTKCPYVVVWKTDITYFFNVTFSCGFGVIFMSGQAYKHFIMVTFQIIFFKKSRLAFNIIWKEKNARIFKHKADHLNSLT